MEDLRGAGGRDAGGRGWRSASTSCSTTPRASTRGRRRRWPATRASSPTTGRSPTASEPDAFERTLPEVFPDVAPGNFTWVPELGPLGVDDVQRLPVGPRLHEPGGVPGDGRGDARPRGHRRRRAAARRRPVPVEARRHELAEPARGPPARCRRSARWCGSRRRPSRSRPRRSSRRRTSSATSAPAATRARSATSPTTTCSWCCCGARSPRAKVALMTRTLQSMPPVPRARAG